MGIESLVKASRPFIGNGGLAKYLAFLRINLLIYMNVLTLSLNNFLQIYL